MFKIKLMTRFGDVVELDNVVELEVGWEGLQPFRLDFEEDNLGVNVFSDVDLRLVVGDVDVLVNEFRLVRKNRG